MKVPHPPPTVNRMRLIAGVAVLIGAAWAFGGIAEDVVEGDPITIVDLALAHWFHVHGTAALTSVMLAISSLHGTAAVTSAVALTAAILACRRNWYGLVTLGLVVPLGMLMNVLMKHAFRRDRPIFDDPLLTLSTYSFPSGHVAGAALFYGWVVAMLWPRLRTWRGQAAAIACALFMISLVALSRVYLGVHFLSDVLAAFAEALAWLALCLTAVDFQWRRRGYV